MRQGRHQRPATEALDATAAPHLRLAWTSHPIDPRLVTTLTGHTSRVTGVCALDPHRIATTSWDRTVRNLTRPDGEECVAAIDVDFGPGAVALVGDRIVTGHENGAVMVWQLHGG